MTPFSFNTIIHANYRSCALLACASIPISIFGVKDGFILTTTATVKWETPRLLEEYLTITVDLNGQSEQFLLHRSLKVLGINGPIPVFSIELGEQLMVASQTRYLDIGYVSNRSGSIQPSKIDTLSIELIGNKQLRPMLGRTIGIFAVLEGE